MRVGDCRLVRQGLKWRPAVGNVWLGRRPATTGRSPLDRL
jgi:hypothetical protein